MKITDGLEMFEITAKLMRGPDVIHPVLIWNNDEAIIVDTGCPGQMLMIKEAIEKAGVPFDKLSRIIITHHDIDHIGSLAAILDNSSHKIEVLAHKEEKPYIQGEKKAIKMTPERIKQMEEEIKSLPEEKQQAIRSMYLNLKANVDRTVVDGEELPYCGGIKVIYTPGHTPGHISLYHKQSKTLICGDIIMIQNNKLIPSIDFFTFDIKMNKESIKKFTEYDIKNIICYHGGLFNNNVNKYIKELI